MSFKDGVFDAVVSINAFEHYHSPHIVTSELMRCLKPGGRVALHTAFMQPLHEAPYHFFNCTEFGLRHWFREFAIDEVSVSPNFNPAYGLGWMFGELEQHFAASGNEAELASFRAMTVEQLARFWRDGTSRNSPEFALFANLPESVQKRFAAGFQLTARKPA